MSRRWRSARCEPAQLWGCHGAVVPLELNCTVRSAIPSLHAAYPCPAFLVAWHYFGRAGWLMLVYSAVVWFSIVYLGEH